MPSFEKKNFMSIPEEILQKISAIESDTIVVACTKKIKKDDIRNGDYNHLSIHYSSQPTYKEYVMPDKSIGRYSKYNILGRQIIRKDLPKVKKTFMREMPIWGDWSKGSFIMTYTMDVWHRDYWQPKNYYIQINLLENNDEPVFKFSVNTHLNKLDSSFQQDLLFMCNLLQENCGLCDVFSAEANDEEYLKTLYFEWEFLPEGELDPDTLLKEIYKRTSETDVNQNLIKKERLDYFIWLRDSLRAQTMIGNNKFNRYFGAKLPNNIVILENMNYGNAIYVFYEDWENLSKLNRIELNKLGSDKFIKIPHSKSWKNYLNSAIGAC